MTRLARPDGSRCSPASPWRKLTCLSVSVAVGLYGMPFFASAQETATNSDTPANQAPPPPAQGTQTKASKKKNAVTLTEVTVTARQRSESIKDVPIAITAFTDQQIEDAGIQSPADFVQLTPNVSMVQSQNAGTDFLTIRGITQVRNGDPPVATVVDGVQQVSPNQFNQDLYDLDSIEVLKGPQGALYGRNALGGAILINTKLPSDTPAGWIQVGVGNGHYRDGAFSFSGPIGNGKVRYLLSGIDNFLGGLIQNDYLHRPVDNARNRGLRLRVLADVTDHFTLDTQASSSRTIGGSLNYVYQPLYGVDDVNNTSIPITANNKGYDIRTIDHFSIKGDYQTSAGTLTAIAALDHINEYSDGDNFPYTPAISANSPLGPGTDGTQAQYLDTNARQVELRFTSPSDEPLRWIAGTSFLHTDSYLSNTIGLDLGRGIIRVKKTPAPANSRNPTSSFLADRASENNSSIFGQVAYDITPKLEADLAWRYDRFQLTQRDVSMPQFDPFAGQVRHGTFSKSQPKFTLTYKANTDFTFYGSWGVGFRSGGFNQNGTGADAASVGLIGVSDLYQPETAKSAELGFKSSLDDNRLQINGSMFDTRDRNQLYFVFVGALGAQVLTNIDKVDLRGYELDAKFRVLDDLTVYGAYGYTHSQIKKFGLDPSNVGNAAPYIPRYTSNIGFQYSPALGSRLNGLLRLDYEVIGPQFWDPGNTTERKAVDLLNLRLGVESWDGKWTATLWAKNATNSRYNAEYVLGGFTQIAEPRSYGIDFRYNLY
ncbi:TonB-dependent receptor [Rhodanobacter sp. PCA2]|uniref:TonB-dependent receptor n=1 Tax=Rhodanobacter sp. PCA2 TaxID=2006117 RepID=UPI0015E76104|nr:TonB-dependent receptor [Rhodanobacter sp. PCA2]MBA2078393.1 TonB-dependent receptor [Rhodanobacter sp. PCA2]